MYIIKYTWYAAGAGEFSKILSETSPKIGSPERSRRDSGESEGEGKRANSTRDPHGVLRAEESHGIPNELLVRLLSAF